MTSLLDQPDTTALGFDCGNHPLRFAQHVAQNNNRAISASGLFILDRYKSGEIALVMKVAIATGARVCDLVFHAVPCQNFGKLHSGELEGIGRIPNFNVGGYANHQGDQSVFTDVAEIVEGVENIPSFVTIEASKQRLDFRSQFFAATPHALIEISGRVSERKGDVPCIGMAAISEMAGEGRVIQAGAGVLDYFRGDDAPSERKPLGELDLVNLVNTVRIVLTDTGIWLFTEELVHLGAKVLKVFLCPRASEMGAVENGRVLNIHGEAA